MARKSMSEDELTALLDGQINDAVSYDTSDLKIQRSRALEYREGIMRDTPSEPGKSSVVSRDVSDTIGWISPGLARVFLSSEHIVIYEPKTPTDVDFAKQATEYINWVLMRDCNGYAAICSAIDDGLLLGNGLLKHWWDPTPTYTVEKMAGIPEVVYLQLVAALDKDDITEHSEYPDPSMPGLTLHDIKFKRKTGNGQMRFVPLPSEEFGIERRARALTEDECGFCFHRYLETRSNLVDKGYPRDTVYALPTYSTLDFDSEEQARDAFSFGGQNNDVDESVERVEVYECYTLADMDGDGIAERVRAIMAGGTGSRNLLEWEEWDDDLPFTDLVPDPIPHRWRGRSVFDETQDIQRIKTVVLRQTLDNLYATNNPMLEVLEGSLVDPNELIDRKIGGLVRVRQPGAINPLVVPFIAKESFGILEYADMIIEKRTGVSRSTMSLDPEALQNQTATAVNATQTAAYSKIELYARNIAENGMKRVAKCMLKLMVKHQDTPRQIKLRDEWPMMDPSQWSPDMDVTINTGLGAGSRDRDLQMLNGIAGKQEQILMQMGPTNPLVPLDKYGTTLRKMVEMSGMKNPDQFFSEMSPEDMAKFAEAANQPKPDPKMMEAQAKLQIEQGKAQSDAQLAQQKAMAEGQLAQQRAVAELQLTRERNQSDIEAQREAGALKMQLMREEAGAKLQLAREEAQVKAELRREEMLLEAQLTAQANAMQADIASRQADTNINRPGGE